MSIVKAILWFFVGIILSVCIYIMAMILLGTFFSLLGYIEGPKATTLSTLFYVALLVIVVLLSLYIISVIRRLKKQHRYSAMSGFIGGMLFLAAWTVYLFIMMVVVGS